MQFILEIFFWLLLSSLFFSYVIYPLLISFLKPIQRGRDWNPPKTSQIHLIIACYNEEIVLEEKIKNSFNIEYPLECKVYVIIDKSSDRTSKIAHRLTQTYPNLIVLDKGYRKGKNDSINFFYNKIKPQEEDILFFTDANTFYQKDSFTKLWDKFKAGAAVVGGSMKYIEQETNSAKSEGLYWKYEEWIRRNEDRFGRAITMNGGNMAMLAKYFKELPLFVPNDFYIPISVVSSNKTSFASASVGVEKAILNEKEELRRKRRMANRQMNAIIIGWGNFSVITKLQLLFHKIIRWFAIPFFLLASILGGFIDPMRNDNTPYLPFFFLGVWGLILVALFLTKGLKVKIPLFSTISYAFLVHFHGGLGALSAFVGKRVAQWGKAVSNR